MAHATPKCKIYNFDEYVPISVILHMLSDNSLPWILIKKEVPKLQHSSNRCAEKVTSIKKTMFIETGIHL